MKLPVDIIGPQALGRSVSGRQETINMFPVIDPATGKKLMWTPGLRLFSSLGVPGRVRGLHVMNGVLYAVAGGGIYTVSRTGEAELVGSIPSGSGPVTMADNGAALAVCDGAQLYTLEDGTVNNPTAASSVTYQDQVFIVSMPDSGEIRHSSLIGEGVEFDPLTSGSAEGHPDNVVRVLSDHRELWAFGTETCEVFYNAGDSDFLFMRLPGGFLECGCGAVHSPAKIDNTVFWLDHAALVRRADGYTPLIVSTDAISQEIKAMSTWTDAEGYTFHMDGHSFYVLAFPSGRKTFVFDIATSSWFRVSSGLDGGLHRGVGCVHVYGKNLMGGWSNGSIYDVSMDTLTENGAVIRRVRTAQPLFLKNGHTMIFRSFELDCRVGDGLVDGREPLVMLQYSDDTGRTWSTLKYKSIGATGKYKTRVIWRRLGRSKERIFKVIVTDPVKFEIFGAYAEIEESTR